MLLPRHGFRLFYEILLMLFMPRQREEDAKNRLEVPVTNIFSLNSIHAYPQLSQADEACTDVVDLQEKVINQCMNIEVLGTQVAMFSMCRRSLYQCMHIEVFGTQVALPSICRKTTHHSKNREFLGTSRRHSSPNGLYRNEIYNPDAFC
jgi:hypothetical protein